MTPTLFYRPAPAPDTRNVLLARLASMAGRPHLAAWILEGADVEALKQKAIERIEKDMQEGGGPLYNWNQTTALGSNLVWAAKSIQPEYFRTIDWLANVVATSGNSSSQFVSEVADFANKYLGPVLMGMRAKNQPLPQLKAKEFDWDAANQFVMENAAYLGDGNYGPYYEEDNPVLDLGDGWRIVELPGGNVETEGEEMNNCLRDNDQYHWTDKTLGEFISVLSLRDPLNRPHVSASVRYNDWQNGNLIYTEGPLLKNNRALREDPKYAEMWGRFEDWIRERGGSIGHGSDDWEEEEAEPYHAEGADTTEYGDYLSVEDLGDLVSIWSEAKNGARDWGMREAEQHDDHDGDGDPYYYYETYGGREVVSDDSGLEQAVQDWMDDVESYAADDNLEMQPRDFVGAVVLWATVLQDAVSLGGPTLLQELSSQLSQRVVHPSDPDVPNEARAMLMWASQQLVSDHSLTAVTGESVPYADTDQTRLNWAAFAPVEELVGEWSEMAQGLPQAIHPEQLEVEEQPNWGELAQQPQQPPQVQGDPAGFRPLTEAERIHATGVLGAEWENNQTPENLNTLGSWLMSTYPHCPPEEATRLLAAVTGQQVGFRQGKVAAEDESGWYEGWKGPEEPQPTYGDFGPSEGVPRFAPGEHVKMLHGTQGGDIVGDPVDSYEGRAYYVNTFDEEGPRGVELWAESLLHRPDRYDEPGESTLQDWFGIPPEGEQYYRTAMAERSGDPQLDALIEEYLQRNQFDWWDADGWAWVDGEYKYMGDQWTREELHQGYLDRGELNSLDDINGGVVSDLKDADYATGICGDLSEDFKRFCQERNVDVSIVSLTPQDFYTDATDYPSDGHALNVVKMPSGMYAVDWTAAQYGYGDVPKVQRLDSEPTERDYAEILRQYNLRPKQAANSTRPVFSIAADGQVFWGEDQAHDDIESAKSNDWTANPEIARGEISQGRYDESDIYDPYKGDEEVYTLQVFPQAVERGWTTQQIADRARESAREELGVEVPKWEVSFYDGKQFLRFEASEWYENPDQADWQHGLCDTYALALMEMYPHLRFGVAGTSMGDLGSGWYPSHYFAHDDQYAYDSLGRHPLPYHGLDNQFDVLELDQEPEYWSGGHGENGGPEDYERAKQLIPQQHPYLQG